MSSLKATQPRPAFPMFSQHRWLGTKLFELFRFQMGFCERDDATPLVVDEKKSKKVLKKQEIQSEASSQQAAAEAVNLFGAANQWVVTYL